MSVAGSLLGPGIEVSEDVESHAARSSVRRMVAALFDAWDDGDARGVATLFATTGRWTDPSGCTVAGPPSAIEVAYTTWRNWEPWSIHWLSNEQITVIEPGRCHGSWLWSAASTIDGGRTAAWSGGDLSLDAVWCESGWRIESLAIKDRYRSAYDRGWLAEPIAPVLVLGIPSSEGFSISVGSSDRGSLHTSLADLSSEVELRSLMGEFIDDLESDRPPSAVSTHWAADGVLILEEALGGTAKGTEAIAGLMRRERVELTALMRMLFSESIEVDGQLASCRWRDLWIGVRNGSAVWVSHRYIADAVRGPQGWRFMRMDRRRVLDCAYDEGWQVGGNSSTKTTLP